MSQRLAEVKQFQDRVATISHHHQGSVGQPTTQLEDNLPGPVGEFLGPPALALVVALPGGQGGEHRQGPDPLHPGDEGQPHQTNPAQAAGFDQVAVAGVYRIPVDTPGANAPTPRALQGLVHAEDQRPLAGVQMAQ